MTGKERSRPKTRAALGDGATETYYGDVRTSYDALKLIEACRTGLLRRVTRRLSRKERRSIRSGSVFVWDEKEAGITRWTDGKSWSSTRLSGGFSVWKELNDDEPSETDKDTRTKDGLLKRLYSTTTSTGLRLHLVSYISLRAIRPDLPQPASDPSLGAAMPLGETYPESGLHLESNGTKSRITPSRDAVLPDAPPSVHQESCTSSRSLDADMGCRRPASTPERQHLSSIDVDPRAESVELAKTRAAEDAAMMSKLNRAFWT